MFRCRACLVFFSDRQRPELLLSGIGIVAGLAYFLYRQHLDETKLFKELFIEFNHRYEEMHDAVSQILCGPTDGELSEEERQVAFKYFNLCAEEYLFYTTGYVDRRVWQTWCRAMQLFLEHPRVYPLWEKEKRNDYYYEFNGKC